MMTKLREYSKVFIIIVALAFIGLMVFEWGMDYTGMSQRQNVIGSVNGQELNYEMYSELYQQLYQNERQRRDDQLTEQQLENLRNQVWEQFVQRVIFEEEIKNLGIAVTDSEIVYQIRNYPLEEIKNNPNFQTDGQFDWNKYYASFTNPQMPWIQIEEFYRRQLPFQKLQNIITATVRVSDSEVEEEFGSNNLKARVNYLELSFAKFRDEDITISDAEVQQYYEEHQDEYLQDETRDLAYVQFSLKPTANDTARIMAEFDDIRKRLAKGEDFNELALEYSEDPAKDSNQGRYDFFERGAMVKPFEEAAFNGAVGSLVGPVETQFGLHLIKIEDKRVQEGKEQVKVSHILLKVVAGPSTREKQENTAAFFAEDARTEGFETVANRQGYEIKTTGHFSEKMSFIPGFGRNYNISDFAFSGELNSVSDLIYTEEGFAVFKVSEIKEAGVRPLSEVESAVRNKIKIEKQKELARNYAVKVETWLAETGGLAAAKARDDKAILKYDSTTAFTLRGSIPGLGFDHKFNAKAFALEFGQISSQIETNRGIYWMELIERTEFDSVAYLAQKESIRQRLLNSKRSRVFTEWYEYLKEQADIEDNREMFNL